MNPQSTYQKLRAHLAYLQLRAAAEAVPAELERASKEGWSPTVFLERLLEIEVVAIEQRRLAGRLRFRQPARPLAAGGLRLRCSARSRSQPGPGTGYPALLGGSGQHPPDRASRRRQDDARHLSGPPGRGSRPPRLLHHRRRVYYTTAADLTARRHRAAIGGRWAATMRFFASPKLLIIDELGYLPLPSEGASALFQVISQRYLKGSICLTTNRGIASWGQIFDDPMNAAAMLDRLLHRSTVIQIDGESYRMRSHRARVDAMRKAVTP